MLVKLTYYKTQQSTLVNLDKVECIYEVFDKPNGKYSTKIQFNGSFINVVETLDEIMNMHNQCITDFQPKEESIFPSWLTK
jgi:hypothetical protein